MGAKQNCKAIFYGKTHTIMLVNKVSYNEWFQSKY